MKKNYLARTFLISATLMILSLLVGYFYSTYLISNLKKYYPVFNEKEGEYELVKKRPKHWVSIKEVSNLGKWAIIISEDWAFYQHNGLDFNQIKDAMKDSILEGRLVRGASTITQQVVKNALLNSEKSLFRKVIEAWLAYLSETKMSKEEILEKYLNLVELGDKIYGIREASYFYFKKHPKNLEAKEAAFLAMLLPSPVRYAQSYKDKKLTDFAKEQIASILFKLQQAKIITEEERISAESSYLSFEANLIPEESFFIDTEILKVD